MKCKECIKLKKEVKELTQECKDACNTIISYVEENNSLKRTLEILRDEKLLKNLKIAMKEIKDGKGLTFKEVFGHLDRVNTKNPTNKNKEET